MARAKLKQPLKQKRKFWQEHMVAWKEMNISQAEYCRRNGLKSKSFTYWKKKQNQDKEKIISFVPVPLPQAKTFRDKAGNASLCMVIDGRFRVEVGDDFSELTLQRLVHALERM